MEFKRRPWGWYLTLVSGRYFKVKILRFKSCHSCSVQRHKHRHELWLFLRGSGLFSTVAIRSHLINEGAKAGDFKVAHRNTWHSYMALKPTTVLEIQYGDQCKEEDIERATL